jgi:hypothetical protein
MPTLARGLARAGPFNRPIWIGLAGLEVFATPTRRRTNVRFGSVADPISISALVISIRNGDQVHAALASKRSSPRIAGQFPLRSSQYLSMPGERNSVRVWRAVVFIWVSDTEHASRRVGFVLQLIDDIRAVQRCPGFEATPSSHLARMHPMAKRCECM